MKHECITWGEPCRFCDNMAPVFVMTPTGKGYWMCDACRKLAKLDQSIIFMKDDDVKREFQKP